MICDTSSSVTQLSLVQLYAVGIDVGYEKCSVSILKPDKILIVTTWDYKLWEALKKTNIIG